MKIDSKTHLNDQDAIQLVQIKKSFFVNPDNFFNPIDLYDNVNWRTSKYMNTTFQVPN